MLTKLGYLIDNPWNNALDRAKAAGAVLADVLIQRHLGVRPITLIGFSLGSRLIFYCLLELHRQKAFGIVQDVIILGTTVTAPQKTWYLARSVVSGRFVNCFARNDWLLNYLFRATSSGLNTIAGLRPVENVPGVENIDVTDKISGHMSYRTFMPLILDQLGFPVSADYFDEPEVSIALLVKLCIPAPGVLGLRHVADGHCVLPHRNPTLKASVSLFVRARRCPRSVAGSAVPNPALADRVPAASPDLRLRTHLHPASLTMAMSRLPWTMSCHLAKSLHLLQWHPLPPSSLVRQRRPKRQAIWVHLNFRLLMLASIYRRSRRSSTVRHRATIHPPSAGASHHLHR